MPAPLTGLRVLDLTRVLAGPLAAQTLADMGAEVIKVERPISGDETRGFPPFSASGAYSSYFGSVNRGKRSITVNMDTKEGGQIVSDLADRSDILLENYKVGGLKKMGLDYATLSARNPRLIYCSITGFGQTGPHSHRAGYDVVIQAMGGLMSLTGETQPMKTGVAMVDVACGLYAVSAILAAVIERQTSNKGQHIDLCLLDVQIASLINHSSSFLMTGEIPGRYGNTHASIVPYQVFETAEEQMVLAVANDQQFEKFAKVLGVPQLSSDPTYSTNDARVRNRKMLVPLIQEILQTRTAMQWMEAFDAVGVPAGPINYLDDVFEDPHVAAHDLIAEYPSQDGLIRVVGNPIKFSRTPVVRELPPPELGAHTDEILRDVLGKSSEEIKSLRAGNVL